MLNRNTLTILVIAGSMFTTPLFASNFFHQLMTAKPSSHLATILHTKSSAKSKTQTYTDFSGNWTGKCSVFEENDLTMDITIENDDTYFNLDGVEHKIGPLHTETTSDNLWTTFDHTSLEWNEDMSMLIMKNISLDKEHSLFPYNDSKPMETYIGKFVFSLNNEQLIIKGQFIGFTDLDQKDGLNNFSCTLNK